MRLYTAFALIAFCSVLVQSVLGDGGKCDNNDDCNGEDCAGPVVGCQCSSSPDPNDEDAGNRGSHCQFPLLCPPGMIPLDTASSKWLDADSPNDGCQLCPWETASGAASVDYYGGGVSDMSCSPCAGATRGTYICDEYFSRPDNVSPLRAIMLVFLGISFTTVACTCLRSRAGRKEGLTKRVWIFFTLLWALGCLGILFGGVVRTETPLPQDRAYFSTGEEAVLGSRLPQTALAACVVPVKSTGRVSVFSVPYEFDIDVEDQYWPGKSFAWWFGGDVVNDDDLRGRFSPNNNQNDNGAEMNGGDDDEKFGNLDAHVGTAAAIDACDTLENDPHVAHVNQTVWMVRHNTSFVSSYGDFFIQVLDASTGEELEQRAINFDPLLVADPTVPVPDGVRKDSLVTKEVIPFPAQQGACYYGQLIVLEDYLVFLQPVSVVTNYTTYVHGEGSDDFSAGDEYTVQSDRLEDVFWVYNMSDWASGDPLNAIAAGPLTQDNSGIQVPDFPDDGEYLGRGKMIKNPSVPNQILLAQFSRGGEFGWLQKSSSEDTDNVLEMRHFCDTLFQRPTTLDEPWVEADPQTTLFFVGDKDHGPLDDPTDFDQYQPYGPNSLRSVCWPRLRVMDFASNGTIFFDEYALGPPPDTGVDNDYDSSNTRYTLGLSVLGMEFDPENPNHLYVSARNGLARYTWPPDDSSTRLRRLQWFPTDSAEESNVKVVEADDFFYNLFDDRAETGRNYPTSDIHLGASKQTVFNWNSRTILLTRRLNNAEDADPAGHVVLHLDHPLKPEDRAWYAYVRFGRDMYGLLWAGPAGNSSHLVGLSGPTYDGWTLDPAESPTETGNVFDQPFCQNVDGDATYCQVDLDNKRAVATTFIPLPASSYNAQGAVIGYLVVGTFVVVVMGFGYWYSSPHLEEYLPVFDYTLKDPFAVRHLVVYLALFVEFLQMASFSFSPAVPWNTDSGVPQFFRVVPLLDVTEVGYEVFNADPLFPQLAGLAAIAFGLVLSVLFWCGAYNLIYRLGKGRPSVFRGANAVSTGLVPLMSKSLLLPLTRYMLKGLDCTFDPAAGLAYSDSSQGPDSARGPNIACFDWASGAHVTDPNESINYHWLTMFFSMAGLILFYPLALRVQGIHQIVQRIQGKDVQIQWLPRFLFKVVTAKFVLALLSVFLTAYAQTYTFALIGVMGYMAIDVIRSRPSGITGMNRLRFGSFACVTWTNVCAVVAILLDDTTSVVPIALFALGVVVVFTLVACLPSSWFTRPQEVAVEPAFGKSKADVEAAEAEAIGDLKDLKGGLKYIDIKAKEANLLKGMVMEDKPVSAMQWYSFAGGAVALYGIAWLTFLGGVRETEAYGGQEGVSSDVQAPVYIALLVAGLMARRVSFNIGLSAQRLNFSKLILGFGVAGTAVSFFMMLQKDGESNGLKRSNDPADQLKATNLEDASSQYLTMAFLHMLMSFMGFWAKAANTSGITDADKTGGAPAESNPPALPSSPTVSAEDLPSPNADDLTKLTTSDNLMTDDAVPNETPDE